VPLTIINGKRKGIEENLGIFQDFSAFSSAVFAGEKKRRHFSAFSLHEKKLYRNSRSTFSGQCRKTLLSEKMSKIQ
jgi:hypothetical protein